MKDLIKIMLALALLFACTFIVAKATGILTLDEIKNILNSAQQIDPIYLFLIVVLLLFSDLFIAIPTMTVTLLSGHFLGWSTGASAAITGMMAAGLGGYLISRLYGSALLQRIYKDETKLAEIRSLYSEYGPLVLIICRAMPILPEVSCCMAGATRMAFPRFITAYTLGTIPYALITSYAGSISTLENPRPAIMTLIALSLALWTAWFLLAKHHRDKGLT